ncbi:MAG: hypothetical protein DRJ05_00010 [Bacteroidetes bacterium]|nr:MAG: hypothetical protein DRJ05_00010 [Bacteroidota bacterium]
MIDNIKIEKFASKKELEELTKETKQFISYLVFFENASGNLQVNHREILVGKFSISNLPILSTIKYNNVSEQSTGWCVTFDKEARDVLLIHSFKLFCPFTGIVNVNMKELIFNKLMFYLKEIQSEKLTKGVTSSEIIYLQASLVIKYISRNIQDNNSTSQIYDKTLKGFADLVGREYKNNHGIDFYTGEIGISSKTLGRLTKARLNITPKQIIQYRINAEAIRLIIHSGLSIKEIAYDLNFSSPDYFNYFFKKLNKTSPATYKKRMSENMRFLS